MVIIRFSHKDVSWNTWSHHWGSSVINTGIILKNFDVPFWMLIILWSTILYSDTLQFVTLLPSLMCGPRDKSLLVPYHDLDLRSSSRFSFENLDPFCIYNVHKFVVHWYIACYHDAVFPSNRLELSPFTGNSSVFSLNIHNWMFQANNQNQSYILTGGTEIA